MKFYLTLFAVAFVLFFSSCNKDKDKSDAVVNLTITGTLTGGNMVPPVTTAANGTVNGTYNQDTKVLTVTVNYTNTTATAIHIHQGGSGVTGAMLYSFTNLTSPATFSVTLTDAQVIDLLSIGLYADIHSAAFPAGEIRGQLVRE